MSFTSRLGMALGLQQLRNVATTIELPMERYSFRSSNTTTLNSYKANSLVYSCVNERMTSVIEAPLIVVDRQGKTVEQGTLHDFMRSPDGKRDATSWNKLFMLYHDLSGNVFIHKGRNIAGRVVKWTILRPDRVTINTDKTGIIGYTYTVDGNRIPVPVEDVAHYKLDDPLDDYYGIGPAGVVAREADLDTNNTSFSAAYILNAGRFPGYLTLTDERVTEEDGEAIRKQWTNNVGGMASGKIPVLHGGAKFTQTTAADSPELPEIRDLTESRICGVFGIDPRLVGTQLAVKASSGRADYETARRSFWRETMKPIYASIESFLNGVATEDFGAAAGTIKFDLSGVQELQEGRDVLAERAIKLYHAGLVDLAVAEEMVGAPVTTGPDATKRVLPLNIVPEGERTTPVQALQQSGNITEAHSRTMTRIAGVMQGDIETALNTIARRAEGIIGTAIAQQQFPEADQLFPDSAADELAEAAAPSITRAAQSGWSLVDDALGPLDVDDTAVQTVAQRGATSIRGVNQTARRGVADVIRLGIDRGYSIRDIAKGVQADGYNGVSHYIQNTYKGRAKVIARTETANALNGGTASRYRASGITHVRIHDGTGDPECASVNGTTQTVDWFESNPINHPNCTMAASPIT